MRASKKIYETERVPVAGTTRIQHIVVSALCIAVGLVIIVPRSLAPTDPDRFAYQFWGFLVGGLGLFFLFYSIRKTHETVLTEKGKAAKAVDDKIESARIAKRDAAFWTVVFWAAVIAGIAYAYDPIADLVGRRVAVYPVYCAVKVHETGQ